MPIVFDYVKYVPMFIDFCSLHKKLSDKTIYAYKNDLSQFKTYSTSISKDILWNYIEELNKSYKPKTVKRKIATLKSFIHFLLIKDIIDYNPFDKIELSIKEPIILPKTIPIVTISRIISYAYSQIESAKTAYQKRSSIRNAAIIELLFATGARIAEICSLSLESVDTENRIVKFNGKGSKERILPIESDDVYQILKTYEKCRKTICKKNDSFFVNKLGNRMSEQSVRCMINKYCKECKIKMHITPHMFRHSFATLLLEEDVDIRYIQKFLGHSSITTTQIYTHVTSAKQKEILKTKHPRNKIII